MSLDGVTEIPATERAVVGLCHGMNDQLAAVSAYLYLLERRGMLGDMGVALRTHVDGLAQTVRLVRSLSREHPPVIEPVALSILAESASELMAQYPEGPVAFRVQPGHEGGVIRCDWSRALRVLLLSAAWASRGIPELVQADLSLGVDGDERLLRVQVLHDVEPPVCQEVSAEPGSAGIRIESTGDRTLVIRFPATS